jgi:HEAT repeat protein
MAANQRAAISATTQCFTPEEIQQLSQSLLLSSHTQIKAKTPLLIDDQSLIKLLTPKFAKPDATLTPKEVELVIQFVVEKNYIQTKISCSVTGSVHNPYRSMQELQDKPIESIVKQDRVLRIYHEIQYEKNLANFKKEDNSTREKVLNLIDWPALDDKFSQQLLQEYNSQTDFKRLVFVNCKYLTDKILQTILYNSPSLQYVTIINCPEVTKLLLWYLSSYCPGIQTLHIKQLEKIVSIAESAFFSMQFPCLQVLHIVGCSGMELITLIRPEQIPGLKQLEIRDCIKLTKIKLVATQAALEHVHIEECPNLQTFKVTAPSTFTKMQILEIIGCPKLEVDSFELQVEVSKLAKYQFKDQRYYLNRYNAMITRLFAKFKIPGLIQELMLILSRELKLNYVELNSENIKLVDQVINNYLFLTHKLNDKIIPMLITTLGDDSSVGIREKSAIALREVIKVRVDMLPRVVQELRVVNEWKAELRAEAKKILGEVIVRAELANQEQLFQYISKSLEFSSNIYVQAGVISILGSRIEVNVELMNQEQLARVLSFFFKVLKNYEGVYTYAYAIALSKVVKVCAKLINQEQLSQIFLTLIKALGYPGYALIKTRIEAARALGEVVKACTELIKQEQLSQIIPALLKASEDCSGSVFTSVRAEALIALGKVGEVDVSLVKQEQLDQILSALLNGLNDPAYSMMPARIGAAKALGEVVKACTELIKQEQLSQIILALFKAAEDYSTSVFTSVRAEALIALGKVGGIDVGLIKQEQLDQILSALLNGLNDSAYIVVLARIKAAKALGGVVKIHARSINQEKLTQIFSALYEASEEHCGFFVTIVGVEVIRALGEVVRACAELIDSKQLDQTISVLFKALNDSDYRFNKEAAIALGEVVKACAKLIEQEHLSQIFLSLFKILSDLDLSKRILLFPTIKTEIATALEQAMIACAKTINQEQLSKMILPEFIKILKNPEIEVRKKAVKALVSIVKIHADMLPQVLPVLLGELVDQEVKIETLKVLKDAVIVNTDMLPQIFPVFLKALVDPEVNVKMEVLKILEDVVVVYVDLLSHILPKLLKTLSDSEIKSKTALTLRNITNTHINTLSEIISELLKILAAVEQKSFHEGALLALAEMVKIHTVLINREQLVPIFFMLNKFFAEHSGYDPEKNLAEVALALAEIIKTHAELINHEQLTQILLALPETLRDFHSNDRAKASIVLVEALVYTELINREQLSQIISALLKISSDSSFDVRLEAAIALGVAVKNHTDLISQKEMVQIIPILFRILDDPNFDARKEREIVALDEIGSINFLKLLTPTLVSLIPLSQQPIKIFGEENPALPRALAMRIVRKAIGTPQDKQRLALVSKNWCTLFKHPDLIAANDLLLTKSSLMRTQNDTSSTTTVVVSAQQLSLHGTTFPLSQTRFRFDCRYDE